MTTLLERKFQDLWTPLYTIDYTKRSTFSKQAGRLFSLCVLDNPNPKTNSRIKITCKLDKCQSQTPFSSAVWSVLHHKIDKVKILIKWLSWKFLGKNKLCQKNVCVKTNLFWRKSWIQKNLSQNKFLANKISDFTCLTLPILTQLYLTCHNLIWPAPTWLDLFLIQQNFGSKNYLVQKNFGSKENFMVRKKFHVCKKIVQLGLGLSWTLK